MNTLKQLKEAYDELLEGNNQLNAASNIFLRDQRIKDPKPPKELRPSSVNHPRVLIQTPNHIPKSSLIADDYQSHSHDELLIKNGLYSALYHLQFSRN